MTDILLNVPESSGPELRQARLKLSQLLDDLENCREDSACPESEIEDLTNQIEQARANVCQLEAAEMQRRNSL